MTHDFHTKSFNNFEDELKMLPNKSGLYYFYDKDNTLLYVGKAKNLKSRINEHCKNNLMDREGKFYMRIMRIKNFSSREQWPKEFEKAFSDFKWRCIFHHQSPIVIDMIFHRVTRIEIEEMIHELTKEREKMVIQNQKPPFNSQIASEEYYEILNEFD